MIFRRGIDVRSVHGSFHFQRHIPRATDSRNVSANYPIHDGRFHQYGRRSGRQVDITSAGGNNATRRASRVGRNVESERGRGGGEGGGRRKGPIPAWRDNLPREFQERNTLIGTKWNKPTNINSATPIRGEGTGSIQIIWPSHSPPLEGDAREEGFLRVPLPRKTHLVRLSPADVIHWMKYRGPWGYPRVIGFDGFTW